MRHQRACFIGANSCPPRPLGTSWPSRNGAYLHAQPDLTMCWTTHNPRTARTRPPRLVTACPSCGCRSRVMGPPGWHVHHGNAHRLDTTCKYESPTTSLDICLASSRPLHTPPPPLPLPRTPCTHPQTATHENDLKSPRGGPTGGGALRGYNPSRHPKPP